MTGDEASEPSDELDAPCGDLLDRLATVVGDLQEGNWCLLSDYNVLEMTSRIEREQRRLYAVFVALAAQFDHRDLATTRGDVSAAALLCQVTHLSNGDCATATRTAAAVFPRPQISGAATPTALPRLARSLAAGDLSARHARVIVSVMDKLGKTKEPVHPETLENCEQVLVEEAARVDPPALQKIAEYLLQLADPDGSLDRDAHNKQEFHIGRRDENGLTRVWGRLDDLTIEALREALEPLARPQTTEFIEPCTCHRTAGGHRADCDSTSNGADSSNSPSGTPAGTTRNDDGLDDSEDGSETADDPGAPDGSLPVDPAAQDVSVPVDPDADSGIGDVSLPVDPDADSGIGEVFLPGNSQGHGSASSVGFDSSDTAASESEPDVSTLGRDASPPNNSSPVNKRCPQHQLIPDGFSRPPTVPTDPRLANTDDALADKRPAALRNAHALAELISRYLNLGLGPAHGGERPHLVATVELEVLEGKVGAATLGHGTPIALSQLRRLACDADIFPVVMAGPSAVLDMGRASRTFSAATRRAIAVRDRGCAWPSCDRPAGWTDAHHVVFWSNGGKSDYSNGVLLCGRHHTEIHKKEWTIAFASDGVPEFTPPAYIDPARIPRRNTLHHQLLGLSA